MPKAKNNLFLDEAGQQKLTRLINEIKERGKNKEYDCIAGVSGGVDSTYMVYTIQKLGLRPLVVHVDNGWDSELAVKNIERVLETLNLDLYTYVMDWETFKKLQVSFLKASVPDAEIPTDHAYRAALYQIAAKRGISYIISGSNVVTEGIMPVSWSYGSSDWRYIRYLHKKFEGTSLKNYPHTSFFQWLYYVFVKGIKTIRILDYVSYNKQAAMQIIQDELGWKYYGGKHYESIYTRFFQGYILPRKFNFDKRKAHLSTLICSGQISRGMALEEMEDDPYPGKRMMEEDREYVIKKLEFTEEEFEEIMSLPPKKFSDYPTMVPLKRRIRAFSKVAKELKLVPRQWIIDFDL